LNMIGESRAGSAFDGTVGAGQCVQIMTGAAVPRGADAVVMQEHTRAEGTSIVFERFAHAGQDFVPEGKEIRAGEVVVPRGARLGYAELAMAAQVGRASVIAYRRPRVAILSTGDEVVAVEQALGPF